MLKKTRPAEYEAPRDSFCGCGYVKVSDITEITGLSSKEIAKILRNSNSAAFSDFSPDCKEVKSLSVDGTQPTPSIEGGYLPMFAWNQIKRALKH